MKRIVVDDAGTCLSLYRKLLWRSKNPNPTTNGCFLQQTPSLQNQGYKAVDVSKLAVIGAISRKDLPIRILEESTDYKSH